MDKEVKNYIEKQPTGQQKIIKKLRQIILKTMPGCDEEMAWGVITYQKKKFYLAGMKERVHMGFAISGLSEAEVANFEGSGKTMRHLKINSLKGINEKKIVKLIKLVDKKAKCKYK